MNSFAIALSGKGNRSNEAVYDFIEQAKYGISLRQFKEEYGYKDLLLIRKNGDIVCTLNRKGELSQNVVTGKLKDSPLGQCFQKGLAGPVIQDFQPCVFSDKQQVALVAAPILQYKKTIGVVVLKLDHHAISTIAQRREGMGASGGRLILSGSQMAKLAIGATGFLRRERSETQNQGRISVAPYQENPGPSSKPATPGKWKFQDMHLWKFLV
ncbi:MAG: hypothetical protein B6245_23515 [Desulfobacteraceae bacterium 4572_88]|nr:MAG: hypothetical protein B6245_23515 [Desulfobacteraceae bacterium 4572_88]